MAVEALAKAAAAQSFLTYKNKLEKAPGLTLPSSDPLDLALCSAHVCAMGHATASISIGSTASSYCSREASLPALHYPSARATSWA
jgi:hypothetical protein